MSELWLENIRTCRSIVQQNLGPALIDIVSGTPSDQEFWQERLMKTRRDVFREDGDSTILSTLEKNRKGNFLGSINAWIDVDQKHTGRELPPMILMNMVFGMGKRLSPFTQALANRKPAFPTPMCVKNQGAYLSTADVAAMSATLWQHHLESQGFTGILVKWGDEAVIPGKRWVSEKDSFKEMDAVRFVWLTEPTEELAREKEWVEFDQGSSQMTFQYTRQDLNSLRQRISQHGSGRCVGVNLGSLGISYRLMSAAVEVFKQDIADENKWVDWDPYTWIALSCQDESEWNAEAAREDRLGKNGIRELEKRIPDFFSKIQQMRETFRLRHGRLPVIGILDFGEPFWMDWGLHLSLRRSLEALVSDSVQGIALRELFQLPHDRDRRGNILVNSSIPTGADIRDSLLVNTEITESGSVIHGGVVVAGRHRKLIMPSGGCVLFCAADTMIFTGAHAIAFYTTGEKYNLAEGDRLACLYFADHTIQMRTNESLTIYEGEAYSQPVMGNPISFEEAARRMSLEDTRLVEKRWSDQWSNWLD
jgi:hypothetical protein